MKIFLGGTCNESTWREELIPLLQAKDIDYFNPVVDDWNEEAKTKETQERQHCSICLYTITPRITGMYSIAEAVEDAILRPSKTIFNVMPTDDKYGFSEGQIMSLVQVGKMVAKHGAAFVSGLDAVMKMLQLKKEYGVAEVVTDFVDKNPLPLKLSKEAEKLSKYIKELDTFIDEQDLNFAGLGFQEKILLIEQLAAMQTYLAVLKKRLSKFSQVGE